MDYKFENLQRAAFTFDRNLNTNVNIAPNQSKLQFYWKGQIEKGILDLSKILTKRASNVSFAVFALRIGLPH